MKTPRETLKRFCKWYINPISGCGAVNWAKYNIKSKDFSLELLLNDIKNAAISYHNKGYYINHDDIPELATNFIHSMKHLMK